MSLLKAFNNHLVEFIDDVMTIYPENIDIKTGKTFLESLIKVNPKILITYWYANIRNEYKDKIDNGDIDFFINKDYNKDLADDWKTGKVHKVIEEMRNLVNLSKPKNKETAMKYIQNLTKISELYFK
jgi:hypothetical protein